MYYRVPIYPFVAVILNLSVCMLSKNLCSAMLEVASWFASGNKSVAHVYV